MQNLLKEVKHLFEKDERIFVDGKILKNKLTELTFKSDESLINLLLSSKNTKEHFFSEFKINSKNVFIFEKDKFISFIQNKEFLPNSYTSFKNKIGLTVQKEFISESRDVVLSWAYKDCVLEGGQEKDNEIRNEIFYNEVLSPDEIDKLLDKKVLTNFAKYNSIGKSEIKKFTKKENLYIKGNNLIALHSIKHLYRNEIKLIYLDPPYNTGDDGFSYNDKFKHSTWLTFIKNRLSIAHELLRKDGVIFVQIDHHELAYLMTIMDEIFGPENKIQIISVKVASPSGFKAVNPGPIDVTEFILFYAKDKNSIKFRPSYVPAKYNTNYNLFVEKNKDLKKWKFIPLKEKVLIENGFKTEKEAKEKYKQAYNSVLENLLAKFAFENADNVASIRDLHKPSPKVKETQDKSKNNIGKIFPIEKQDGSLMYIMNGGVLAFYRNKLHKIDDKVVVTELLSNFWDHISWAGIAKEGGVRLKNGKKPEKLIKQLIELICDNKEDIIMDFFSGSGTTAAVAHKMGHPYVAIEQIDYGDNDTLQRLLNVINGDQSGVSKLVNWEGGGEFIYFELKELNQKYVSLIARATSRKELWKIYSEMKEKGFIVYELMLNEFIEKDFEALTLEEQKNILFDCLDKNHLYLNYSEIEDVSYGIDSKTIELNHLFYE